MLVGGLSCLLLVRLDLQVISACCRSPTYFDLAVGTAADFVAGFLGSLCSIFPRIFCCQSGESYENVGDDDDDNIVNILVMNKT